MKTDVGKHNRLEYNTVMEEVSPNSGSTASPGSDQLHYVPDQQPDASPQYEGTPHPKNTSEHDAESVSWSASEYIEHQKTIGWYMVLFLAAILIAGVIYLLSASWLSVGVIILGAVALSVLGARKPHTLTYQIDRSGLRVGERHFAFNKFRSFAIIQDNGIPSLLLSPLQRFMPPLNIYFAPEDGDKIVSTIAHYLPREDHQLDPFDKLARYLRF